MKHVKLYVVKSTQIDANSLRGKDKGGKIQSVQKTITDAGFKYKDEVYLVDEAMFQCAMSWIKGFQVTKENSHAGDEEGY